MPAFYRSTLPAFLDASESELLGVLTLAHADEGFEGQRSEATMAWAEDVRRLRSALSELQALEPQARLWTVLLEFVIPRKGKRIDVVLLTAATIILLEQKSGVIDLSHCRQVEEYALLLHYFHEQSARRRIIPLVVSPVSGRDQPTRQHELPLFDTAAYWIQPVLRTTWSRLPELLRECAAPQTGDAIDPDRWDSGEYFPVPSIIEAARTLQSGLSIREIAHSRAAGHDITMLSEFVRARVEEARVRSEYVICFVTGVPGSGKTLVGLSLAFMSRGSGDTLSFMSGNGPLVMVLKGVFAEYRHKVEGYSANESRIHAGTLIEDVHLFAKTYTTETPDAVPHNHVVIFDEAQRAWDFEHSFRKFKREYSEPEMFLRIMERHQDWAVIIALVGGGQEINEGEAGLAEWGRALAAKRKPWRIYASPDVVQGGDSVAGSSLCGSLPEGMLEISEDAQLHLNVSVRNLNAEHYSKWVNCVVQGDSAGAFQCKSKDTFPVYLTRDLGVLRQVLRHQTIGERRCGLAGSSKAERLRAEGLEPSSSFHAEYPWDKWYLAPESDVRCSAQLEVYATEFEIQGLELDWIGLCWGGDFIWSAKEGRWLARKFHNARKSGWAPMRMAKQQTYRRNSYRVLLTRARQGIVLFVPRGDASDPTRDPAEFDDTARFLIDCGVKYVSEVDELPLAPDGAELEESLFPA
jgi:hypothetical protein